MGTLFEPLGYAKPSKTTSEKTMRKHTERAFENNAQRVRKNTPNRSNNVSKNMPENHAEIILKIIGKPTFCNS